MGDDELRTAGQSQFEHQIVLGVGQMWPPKKMDPALDALGQEIVEKVVDVLRGMARSQPRTTKDILILQAKRRRNDGLEVTRAELLNEAEGCSAPRAERRQQDMGIDDDSHDGNASGFIWRGKT